MEACDMKTIKCQEHGIAVKFQNGYIGIVQMVKLVNGGHLLDQYCPTILSVENWEHLTIRQKSGMLPEIEATFPGGGKALLTSSRMGWALHELAYKENLFIELGKLDGVGFDLANEYPIETADGLKA
jgi:hypothetical protein